MTTIATMGVVLAQGLAMFAFLAAALSMMIGQRGWAGKLLLLGVFLAAVAGIV